MNIRFKEEPKEWRKNVWLTALGLALVSSFLRWRHVLSNSGWAVILALLLLASLLAAFQPRWFRPYYRFSMRAGFWLSQILARVFLSIIFVIVIVPLGLLLRLMGKDPLRLKRRPNVSSYWTDARETSPLDRLF